MRRQRGAAILTAMLTVVLVATLASATLWQQWRGVEVETAERARVQSVWVLTGALDWARLILREDGRKGGADHLAEPWAVPLAPARLSTFLAADRSDALEAESGPDAFLSGEITDLQSRLNVANLINSGKVDAPSLVAFTRLFELLDLPQSELAVLAENLRLAQSAGPASVPGASVTEAAVLPLLPQEIDQLSWLGVSGASIAVLRPFITLLPVRTPVNLNTAPTEVLYACVSAFSQADAQRLVAARAAMHLTTINDAGKLSGNTEAKFVDAQHSVSSRFFEIRGQLRLDQASIQELSVVQRDGMEVKTLWRRHGITSMQP
jgi:general secretion pathway protein K